MKSYIGIDPGVTGGIAIVGHDGIGHAWKMPDTERDVWDLVFSLRTWNDGPTVAVIEHVHAMPKQGVTSVFTFGRGYGGVRMALIGCGIPFTEVTPQKWQKEMHCMTRGDKNVSKSKAQQYFPTLKVTHAIADALLIATFLRAQHRLFKEQP